MKRSALDNKYPSDPLSEVWTPLASLRPGPGAEPFRATEGFHGRALQSTCWRDAEYSVLRDGARKKHKVYSVVTQGMQMAIDIIMLGPRGT